MESKEKEGFVLCLLEYVFVIARQTTGGKQVRGNHIKWDVLIISNQKQRTEWTREQEKSRSLPEDYGGPAWANGAVSDSY